MYRYVASSLSSKSRGRNGQSHAKFVLQKKRDGENGEGQKDVWEWQWESFFDWQGTLDALETLSRENLNNTMKILPSPNGITFSSEVKKKEVEAAAERERKDEEEKRDFSRGPPSQSGRSLWTDPDRTIPPSATTSKKSGSNVFTATSSNSSASTTPTTIATPHIRDPVSVEKSSLRRAQRSEKKLEASTLNQTSLQSGTPSDSGDSSRQT